MRTIDTSRIVELEHQWSLFVPERDGQSSC